MTPLHFDETTTNELACRIVESDPCFTNTERACLDVQKRMAERELAKVRQFQTINFANGEWREE